MRCLSHLGEWEQAAQLAESEWARADPPAKRRLAPMAANAWWRGGRLDAMRVYLPYMDEKTVDGAFCRGLLLVHDGKFDDALQVLDMARDLMYTEVSALVGESYERAYKSVVKAQQVAELEEVIMYRQSYERADGVEHREHLRQMWGERLKGIQGDVDVWQGILAVHSLVVPPHDNSQAWLKFAALCRNTKRFNLSEKALSTLLGGAEKRSLHELATSVEPTVALAWFKHLWEVGEKDKALLGMQTFARVGNGNHSVMARCHLKLGEWVWSIGEDHLDDALIQRVLGR
jgi:FKBP12-rapamycin complex-associated protein